MTQSQVTVTTASQNQEVTLTSTEMTPLLTLTTAAKPGAGRRTGERLCQEGRSDKALSCDDIVECHRPFAGCSTHSEPSHYREILLNISIANTVIAHLGMRKDQGLPTIVDDATFALLENIQELYACLMHATQRPFSTKTAKEIAQNLYRLDSINKEEFAKLCKEADVNKLKQGVSAYLELLEGIVIARADQFTSTERSLRVHQLESA